MPVSPNLELLSKINQSQSWFHAKKTRPIWAKMLQRAQTVETLEGRETAGAGDYLCRGESGEVWPQRAKSLEAKYTPTDTVDGDGWRKYQPRPDAEGVLAAKVEHPFSLEAKWGLLKGKAGDYVVKSYRDKDTDYPDDVWIVDRDLFLATYEPVGR